MKKYRVEFVALLVISLVLNCLFAVKMMRRTNEMAYDEEPPNVVQEEGASNDRPVPAQNAGEAENNETEAWRPNWKTMIIESALFDVKEADGKKTMGTISLRMDSWGCDELQYSDLVIEPAPENITKFNAEWNYVSVCGTFDIGKTYTFIFKKGARYNEGVLAEDCAFVYTIKELAPFIECTSQGLYYPAKVAEGKVANWVMPIRYMNTKEAYVTLEKMEEQNLDISSAIIGSYWDDEREDRYFQKCCEKTYKLPAFSNSIQEINLDISDLAENLKPGLYRVLIGINKTSPENCRKVVLSDLAVSTTLDREGGRLAVGVMSLSGMQTIQGAQVDLFSQKRHQLGSGKTGKDGMLVLDFASWSNMSDDPPHTLVVRKDGDLTFMRLGSASRLSNIEFEGNAPEFPDNYYAFLYTERDIYRPGETVNVTAVIRERKGDDIKAAKVPCVICIYDPQNHRLHSRSLESNEDGFVASSFEIPNTASAGEYRICIGTTEDEAYWRTCSVIISAFTPDRIKAELASAKEWFSVEEQLVFNLRANYYFGAPADDVIVKSYLYASQFKPKHWGDYCVGVPSSANQKIFTFRTEKALKNGELTLAIPSLKYIIEKAGKQLPTAIFTTPLTLQCEANVSEREGGTVTAHAIAQCSPCPFYIGMKMGQAVSDDAEIAFKLLSSEENGTLPEENVAFKLTLEKIEYEYVNTVVDGRNRLEWRRSNKEYAKLPSIFVGKDEFLYKIPNLPDGQYELTAEGEENVSTRLSFFHYSGEPGTVRSEDPNILELLADKEIYACGETATLEFDGDGDGVCLLACGERRLDTVTSYPIHKGQNKVTFAIPQNVPTGVYYAAVTTVCVSGKNFNRKFAVASLKVTHEDKRMKLELTAPQVSEPQSKVKIVLKAFDQEGKPASGTVQIFAVDEGILALTNYKLPDIYDFFFGKFQYQHETYDIFGNIIPDMAINTPPKTGGDGMLALRRRHIKQKDSAVLVLPFVKIPDSGLLETEIQLPKHIGAMRLMAVAAGQEQCGSCESSILMRCKANVLPGIPKAVAQGDKFFANFSIVNTDLEDAQLKLTVTLPEVLTTEGTPEFVATVPKGTSVHFALPLTVKADAMDCVCNVKYTLKGKQFSYSDEAIVNVRSVMPTIVKVNNVALAPGENLEDKLGDGEWTRLDRREIEISASPALAVKDAMEWLNKYPYGCLEQTVSGAFPFLAVDKLVKAGLVPEAFAPQSRSKVNRAVVSVLGMMRSSSGFVGWPDGNSIWHDASVYAAHFLALSKVKLQPGVLNDLSTYLAWAVRTGCHIDCDSSSKTYMAYALYVASLFEFKKINGSTCRRKLANIGDEPYAAFLLGAALYNLGFAAEGAQIVKNTLDSRFWELEAQLPWFLDSPVVRTALVLSIGMDILPEDPHMAEMAMSLSKMLRKDGNVWGTTRDNAMAAFGLAAFAEHYKVGDASFRIVTGTEEKDVQVSQVYSKTIDGDEAPVSIVNTGNAPIFVKIKSCGIPKSLDNSNDCIQVTKEFLDEEGRAVTSVKQGDLITVKMTLKSRCIIENLVLLDLIPAGFSIENCNLATRSKVSGVKMENIAKLPVTHQEYLDDRVVTVGRMADLGTYGVTYRLRAVNSGIFNIPPTRAEDMYNPDLCGTFLPKAQIAIEARK